MKKTYEDIKKLPRFLMWFNLEKNEFVKIEVLDTFTFNGLPLEFNLRQHAGDRPDGADLIRQLQQTFKIPNNYWGEIMPMAGDCTVVFRRMDYVNMAEMVLVENPARSDTFGFCNGAVKGAA